MPFHVAGERLVSLAITEDRVVARTSLKQTTTLRIMLIPVTSWDRGKGDYVIDLLIQPNTSVEEKKGGHFGPKRKLVVTTEGRGIEIHTYGTQLAEIYQKHNLN